ncbi:HIT domain-containing protein, partial [Candidatus Woesearchaeota archaeon]|nr:HIT domain-containing protein [Candidatus Woesearchaeota archaeon]
KIVKGHIPSETIYEDDYVLAFLDIGPVHKGHTLVIPKEHHETLLEMPDEQLKHVSVALKKVAVAVKKATECDGISLAMSNHEAAGQVVPHAHFHIMPRFENDGLKLWPQGKYEEDEMKEFGEKIRSHIGKI